MLEVTEEIRGGLFHRSLDSLTNDVRLDMLDRLAYMVNGPLF